MDKGKEPRRDAKPAWASSGGRQAIEAWMVSCASRALLAAGWLPYVSDGKANPKLVAISLDGPIALRRMAPVFLLSGRDRWTATSHHVVARQCVAELDGWKTLWIKAVVTYENTYLTIHEKEG